MFVSPLHRVSTSGFLCGPLDLEIFEFYEIIESIWNLCSPEIVNSKISVQKTSVFRFSSLKLWRPDRRRNVNSIVKYKRPGQQIRIYDTKKRWRGNPASAQWACHLLSLSQYPLIHLGREEQVRKPCSRTDSTRGPTWGSNLLPWNHESGALQLSYRASIRLKKKKKILSQSCHTHLFFGVRLIQQNSRFEFFLLAYFFQFFLWTCLSKYTRKDRHNETLWTTDFWHNSRIDLAPYQPWG